MYIYICESARIYFGTKKYLELTILKNKCCPEINYM